jgi:erythromycin esterase-like protein
VKQAQSGAEYAHAKSVAAAVRATARPLSGGAHDYDPLMELIGTARFVMLGATAHGTHEFSRERAEIIKRLIREKGFTAIAVEADWPAACRVDRYARGASNDVDAIEALPISAASRPGSGATRT